jgi:hypothetical protein
MLAIGCAGYLVHLVRHVTGHSTTDYRRGWERDPRGHGASLEPKGEVETSWPSCAHGTWDSLRKETSRRTESSESSELRKTQHLAKVTGLVSSERDPMRDAGSRPTWMSRSAKR